MGLFDESQHPRAGKGDSTGGQFTHFHGTHHEFTDFDRHAGYKHTNNKRAGSIDPLGTWFTNSAENAKAYGPRVMGANVEAKKPFTIHESEPGQAWNKLQAVAERLGGTEKLREWLQKNGYDAVVMPDVRLDRRDQTVTIALDAPQMQLHSVIDGYSLLCAVQAYARAPLPGQLGLKFDESKHPRAKGPKVGGQFVAGEHGASHTFPEAGGRYGFTAKITGRNEKGHVEIKSEMGTATVPQESMQHFYSDMTGDVSYLKKHGSSGHAAVDNVIHGGAEVLGKGNDSVVWKSGGHVVKSSTTVPYHPMSGRWAHGLPHEAVAKAQKQHDMTEEMRAAGVTGIPEQETVQHGDRLFTVRDHLEIPDKLNEKQLLQARDHLKTMHDAGYSVNDQLQFGVGDDGNVYHFDLGQADKARGGDGEWTDDVGDDRQAMRRLYDESGVRYDPPVEELERDMGKALRHIKTMGGIDNAMPHVKRQFDKAYGALSRDKHPWSDYLEGVSFGLSDDEITKDMDVEVPAGIYKEPDTVKAATDEYARAPLAGQMGFNFDEAKHPRETTSHDTKHAGEFAPKKQAPVPDGKVKMVQAPKGGAHSNVNGKFYKGGHWMPVHGLSAGRPKPKPRPKADPFGGAPVADPDGKGRAPVARQLSPEQIAEQKERQQQAENWIKVQTGPVGEMMWVGDKPGKTGWNVTKQLIPYFSALPNEQIEAIGEWARQRVMTSDNTFPAEPGYSQEDMQAGYFRGAEDQTTGMFVSRKMQRAKPPMGKAVEAIRQITNLPDQVQVMTDLNEYMQSVLGGMELPFSDDRALTPEQLMERDLSVYEPLQRAVGYKKTAPGKARAEKVIDRIRETDGGAVIMALLAVNGSQTGYDRNGFANRGMDAYSKVINGRFTNWERASAKKWLLDNFGPEREDSHVNQYRWLVGVLESSKTNLHMAEHQQFDEHGKMSPRVVEGYSLSSAVDDYARPLPNQMGFNFDEQQHPREAAGKTEGGRFAKKPGVSRHAAWAARRHKHGDHPTSFLSGHSSKPVRDAAKENDGLGLLITPHTQSYIAHIPDYSHIALDNGVYSEFTGSAPFSHNKFMDMLNRVAANPEAVEKTQFVVAPDRVGDWEGTIERSRPYFAKIRELGFPVAFAAQDGMEDHMDQIPWDEFDVLFMGGSTPWKLGFDPKGQYKDHFRPTDAELRKAGMLPNHIELQKEAKRRGKRIHMGRVNSHKRMVDMAHIGLQANTADGNYIGVAPDKNLPDVLNWLGKTGGDTFTEQKAAEPAERYVGPKRRRRIRMDTPIEGPSGAKLHRYEWRSLYDETQERRFSDWDQSETSGMTGRDIVHVFEIEDTKGNLHQASLESALQEMGYLKGSDSAKGFTSLASALKKRALMQMEFENTPADSWKHKNLQRKMDDADVKIKKLERAAADPGNTEDGRRDLLRRALGALTISNQTEHGHATQNWTFDEIAAKHHGVSRLREHPEGYEEANRIRATARKVAKLVNRDIMSGRFQRSGKPLNADNVAESESWGTKVPSVPRSDDKQVKRWYLNNSEELRPHLEKLEAWLQKHHPRKEQYSLAGSVTRYARAVQHSQGVRAYANYIEAFAQ